MILKQQVYLGAVAQPLRTKHEEPCMEAEGDMIGGFDFSSKTGNRGYS